MSSWMPLRYFDHLHMSINNQEEPVFSKHFHDFDSFLVPRSGPVYTGAQCLLSETFILCQTAERYTADLPIPILGLDHFSSDF